MVARRGGGGGSGVLTQPLQAVATEESSSLAQRLSVSSPSPKDDNVPCVLFLEGWSPGPFLYLQRALKQWQVVVRDDDDDGRRTINSSLASRSSSSSSTPVRGIRILQPRLDMPPMTFCSSSTTWCCNVRFALMMLVCILYAWAARRMLQRAPAAVVAVYYQYLILLTLMGLVLMRAVVSEVVRMSIRYNLELCQGLLSKHKNNIVLVVGFSWGAAMGAELVAQGILGAYNDNENNDNNVVDRDDEDNIDSMFVTDSTNHRHQQQHEQPPAVLLIAPTTSLIASLSILKPYRTDAALRIVASAVQSKGSLSSIQTTTTTETHTAENRAGVIVSSDPLRYDGPSSSLSPSSLALIQVVHAQDDGFFCPNPERWQQQQTQQEGQTTTTTSRRSRRTTTVVDLTMIPDENHVFQRASTQRTLTDIMLRLLRNKGAI